jgi:Ankyrin repeats (3 copies)
MPHVTVGSTTSPRARAASYEELKPLNSLVKKGQLFAVEAWLKAGRPMNLPLDKPKRTRWQSPLGVAMESGFHSLVELLVKHGAEPVEPYGYDALRDAIRKNRLDLVGLLVDNGADVRSVSMVEVFDCWQPEIMEFFIEHGADVETGNPLAYALCHRIRTALRIFKQYKDRFPSFQEQANIALRHHCAEGNIKWVSLMVWAGADPNAPGPSDFDAEPSVEEDVSGLELAAICERFGVFDLKSIHVDPASRIAGSVLRCACSAKTTDQLERFIRRGFRLNDQANGGSSLFAHILERMSWNYMSYYRRSDKNNDSEESREKLKMIHLIAKHGAKWIPAASHEPGGSRRALLRMTPDYTAEFVWIMAKYQACTRGVIKSLLAASSIRSHLGELMGRVNELVATVPERGPGMKDGQEASEAASLERDRESAPGTRRQD